MGKVSTSHDHGRPLNRRDYKTLSLAALGPQFYDFIIFVFFAVVIGELFFSRHSRVAAPVPDLRHLRRRLPGSSLGHHHGPLWRSSSAASGCSPLSIIPDGLADLTVDRPAAHLRRARHRRPCCCCCCGSCRGRHRRGSPRCLGLRGRARARPPGRCRLRHPHRRADRRHPARLPLVATAINRGMSPGDVSDWGWRLAFVLGGVFGIVAMYLRRWLHETRSSPRCRPTSPWPRSCPSRRCREHKGSVVVSMLLTWLLRRHRGGDPDDPDLSAEVHGISPADALTANSGHRRPHPGLHRLWSP